MQFQQPVPSVPDNTQFFDNDFAVFPSHFVVEDYEVPKFGDDTWDLRSLGQNPAVSKSNKILRFEKYDEKWKVIVKTILAGLINFEHPKLQEVGFFPRFVTHKPGTLRRRENGLSIISRWAVLHEKTTDLEEWTDKDILDLLRWLKENYARTTVENCHTCIEILKDFSVILPSPLTAHVPPARINFKSQVKTKPIPPEDFWILIKSCWQFIDVYSIDILDAREEFRRQHENAARFLQSHASGRSQQGTFDESLMAYLKDPTNFIPLHVEDSLSSSQGEINWSALGLRLGWEYSNFGSGNKLGKKRRQLVFDAIDKGFPTFYGGLPREMQQIEMPDGSFKPWCIGIDETSLLKPLRMLHAACFIFIAALTLMRASELKAIECNSIKNRFGTSAIHSRVFKHRTFKGDESYWWITEPVEKAVHVVERIVGSGRLFSLKNLEGRGQDFNHTHNIRMYVAYHQKNAINFGLPPLQETKIAAHRLRRTMAIVTANQPNGIIALGITLKHNATQNIANIVTMGYAAETNGWEKEFRTATQKANAARLVSDWCMRKENTLVAVGPGSSVYESGLDRVSSRLESLQFTSDRQVRDLLRDEFSTIELGMFNHCLGDLEKAKCLIGKSAEQKQLGPTLSDCMRGSCPNSVITQEHLPLWENREREIKNMLKDKRMAERHRIRLEGELAEVSKVTGAHAPNE